MTDRADIEREARQDLQAVKLLRQALAAKIRRAIDAESLPEGVSQENASSLMQYLDRQGRIQATLLNYYPLFRSRHGLKSTKYAIRVYYSPSGEVFTAVQGDEDEDNYLVSWAHPIYSKLQTARLHQKIKLDNRVEYEAVSATLVTTEDRKDGTLGGLQVILPGLKRAAFVTEVRWTEPYVTLRGEERPQPVAAPAPEPVGEETLSPALLALLEELPSEDAVDELTPASSQAVPRQFALSTRVHDAEGTPIEIPFALDDEQNEALKRNAPSGTVVLLGPPGTGKTTVALLRATMFLHSIYRYDENGRQLSTSPEINIRPEYFRVFVVTDHLTGYLKEFLSSHELALPSARVLCLRKAFVEEFVRDGVLTRWLRGVGFVLDDDLPSDPLMDYLKSLPLTLAMAYGHAVASARATAGEGSSDLLERVRKGVISATAQSLYQMLLGKETYKRAKDSGRPRAFLEALADKKLAGKFEAAMEQRQAVIARGLQGLKRFLDRWFTEAQRASERASDDPLDLPLRPGADELLLCAFVAELNLPGGELADLGRDFIRLSWGQLERLLNPREILLSVIGSLEAAEATLSLPSGFDRVALRQALSRWRAALKGGGGKSGVFVRSDFPLIAALARTFLAVRPDFVDEGQEMRLGFLLPGKMARYDHVIVDEAQDFTFAEIQLVRSLVEPKRQATTIAGDPQQRMDWRSGLGSIELLKPGADRIFTVSRNYRQTRELSTWLGKLATGLFKNNAPAIGVSTREGPQPEVAHAAGLTNMAEKASQWIRLWFRQASDAFVALLLVGWGEAEKADVATRLNELLRDDFVVAEPVADGRLIAAGRVTVSEVPTVKGLEFEGVVVLLSERACSELEEDTPDGLVIRNKLYVACSRAKQWLGVVTHRDCPVIPRP